MKKREVKASRSQDLTSALCWRDERNRLPRLTVERARRLVHQLLRDGHMDDARALVELVTGIAYEPDLGHRDYLGIGCAQEAYSMTPECTRAVEEFATRAALRHASTSTINNQEKGK